MADFESESQKFFSFFCPLTYDVMKDPVMASDSITYERAAILQWIEISKEKEVPLTSPITRGSLTEVLHPNIALREVLGELRSHLKPDVKGQLPNLRAAFVNAKMDVIPEISGLTRALSSEVFDALDALMHLDLMSKLDLQAPQVVVIGSENHGKSTLLERLIGFPIFPRHRTLCTRCPIRVKLRRHAGVAISSIYIRDRSSHVVDKESVAPIALEMMSFHVQALMDKMLQGQPPRTIIGDREIVVEIRVPYCPNIDILDMPGLVAAPQEAADISLELTRSIIVKEAAHSIFLLVVDCRTECTASIATRLVLDNKIESQTIGIFTKMDIFSNEYEDSGESKLDLFLSYMDPQNAGYVHLPKGWMGCASLPQSKLEDKPMQRLLMMEKKERAMLRLDYGPLFDSKKVGMIAIRDGVQREFEHFLCNGWVKKIDEHLKNCFIELSDRNANLGLPMPPLSKYKELLDDLTSLMPNVYPEYDINMLKVTEENEFKDILLARVKIVSTNCVWMEFHSWSFWATTWKDLYDLFDVYPIEGKNHFEFDHCIAESRERDTLMRNCLYKLVISLGDITDASLSVRFMDAVLNKNIDCQTGERMNKNVFQRALSFVLSSFETNKMPDICKLERFPLLIESFEAYMTGKISIGTGLFRYKANKYISELPRLVDIRYSNSMSRVIGEIHFKEDFHMYGSNILTIYLEEIISSLPSFTEEWEAPGTYLEENCAVERIDLLSQMAEIANGMTGLVKFVARVEASDLI